MVTARVFRVGSYEYVCAASVRKSYALLAPIPRGSQATGWRVKIPFFADRCVRLYMFTVLTVICEIRNPLHTN